MLRKLIRNHQLLLIVVIAILIGGSISYGFSLLRHEPAMQKTMTVSSTSFHYKCSLTDKKSLPCLQQKYADLTRLRGAAVSFSALKTAYATDDATRSGCHQLTHAIGRAEADTVKDVSQAYALGDNFCWSGYYHGVMESLVIRMGEKNLNNHLATICAPLKAQKPYSFTHYNCVHGLGHGIMVINGSQLFSALKTCDSLADSWERQSCYGGAFMENEMEEVNPNHATNYLKSDEPMYPCTAVGEAYKYQCYLMQTSHALKLANNDFVRVFNECAAVESRYAIVCYQSLGRDASGNSNSQVEPTLTNCMYGPDQTARENCIIGAVKDFVSYYHSDQQATMLCTALDPSLQSMCQTTADSYSKTL